MGLHKNQIFTFTFNCTTSKSKTHKRTTSGPVWRHIEEGANYKSNINPTMWNEPQI